MHTLVCRVFKWNYEQLLYGQTFLPTDIRFARANAPLNQVHLSVRVVIWFGSQRITSSKMENIENAFKIDVIIPVNLPFTQEEMTL